MKFIKHNIPRWQRYYYMALFDKTEVKVFYDLGAPKIYMEKSFYEGTKYLHRLPKVKPSFTGIKIGNGAVIPVNLVIPVDNDTKAVV